MSAARAEGSGANRLGPIVHPRNPRRILRFFVVAGPRRAISIFAESVRPPTSRPWFTAVTGRAQDAQALEIGGPSAVFADSGRVPLASRFRTIDLIDFAPETLWTVGHPAVYGVAGGSQIRARMVCEATDLRPVPDSTYDYVLASHVLEHIANPIHALVEWRRVLRPGGTLVVVVPDGALTFDHRRTPTPFAHLLDDFNRGTPESDLTHLPEVVRQHDLSMDPEAGSRDEFVQRSQHNATIRAMHHHVFTLETLSAALHQAGLQVVATAPVAPVHLLAVGRRPP